MRSKSSRIIALIFVVSALGFMACEPGPSGSEGIAPQSGAQKADAVNVEYFDLKDQPIAIDVINKDDIHLRLVVTQKDGVLDALPTAKVVDERVEFECTIQSVTLLSQKWDESTKLLTKTYDIVVHWSPGDDGSGCDVEIGDTLNQKTYKAELYMVD
jgi:hypothetical protein